MKTNMVLLVLVVIVFALLGLLYVQFSQLSQATGKEVASLKERLSGFEANVASLSTQVKGGADTVNANEAQIKDIFSKIDKMNVDILQMQGDVKNYISSKNIQSPSEPETEPSAPVVPQSEPASAASEQPAVTQIPQEPQAEATQDSTSAPVELGEIPVQK